MRVETQDGPPQADATGLQRFGKGEVAENLLAHHSLNQALMAAHELIQTAVAARLRLFEEGDFGEQAGIPPLTTTARNHGTPPSDEMSLSCITCSMGSTPSPRAWG